MNLRFGYSTTVNRPEFRELAAFEFTDVVGSRAVRGNPDLERALIQNVDGRWELFSGGRGIIAASAFYKHFDKPIERVVIAGAQPIVTFQNADSARNFGIELEAGRQFTKQPLRQRQLHLRRFDDHAGARAAHGADLARAAAGRPVGEPVQR